MTTDLSPTTGIRDLRNREMGTSATTPVLNPRTELLTRTLIGLLLALGLGAFGSSAVLGQNQDKAPRRSFEVDEQGRLTETHGRAELPGALGSKLTSELPSVLGGRNGRGYLGLQFSELTPELRAHFGAPQEAGVLVSSVDADSPAAAAGIVVGDVLTAIDGKPIEFGVMLKREVRTHKAGDTVNIEIFRAGRPDTVLVELGERDPVSALAFRPMLDGRLRVSPLFDLPAGQKGLGIDMDEALGQLDGFFGSAQWLETLKSLEGVDLHNVEDRMREVEERMRELELQLESKSRESKSAEPEG